MSFIELATRQSPDALVQYLNEYLEPRMFLVGHSITAADVTTLAYLL